MAPDEGGLSALIGGPAGLELRGMILAGRFYGVSATPPPREGGAA
ncbi:MULTISPECIES: hypothetical protein [unclassified Nonomuraea]